MEIHCEVTPPKDNDKERHAMVEDFEKLNSAVMKTEDQMGELPPNVADSKLDREESTANTQAIDKYEDKIRAILEKIKPHVEREKECIIHFFRNKDRLGYTHITVDDMKEFMDKSGFKLSEHEKWLIVRYFDLHCNGRFNYLRFMNAFGFPETAKPIIGIKPYCPSGKTVAPEELWDYQRTVNKAVNTLHHELLRQKKNLWRVFQKYDVQKTGLIEYKEFKKVLKMCGICFSDDDLYHLLSEFDKDLDGKIGYQEFLISLINM